MDAAKPTEKAWKLTVTIILNNVQVIFTFVPILPQSEDRAASWGSEVFSP